MSSEVGGDMFNAGTRWRRNHKVAMVRVGRNILLCPSTSKKRETGKGLKSNQAWLFLDDRTSSIYKFTFAFS
jgi:hypothetical protein